MVNPVNNQSNNISSYELENLKERYSNSIKANQSHLNSDIQKATNPALERSLNLKKQTDKEIPAFIEKTALYAKVVAIKSFCNSGPKTENDDYHVSKIVQDLSKVSKPGFYSINKAMKKYFPNISTIKMIFWYFFVLIGGFLPKLYIQRFIERLLHFVRYELNEGDNLPVLGSKVLKILNNYLSNYNRTAHRFREDKNNLIGDLDTYIKQEFNKPELLGFSSVNNLHKCFAKAASRDDIRPVFEPLSRTIRKVQTLDFDFLKNHLSPIRALILPFTYLIGLPAIMFAKIFEYPIDLIFKKIHMGIIKYFMPTVIDSTLEAVAKPTFTYSLNTMLCEFIQDFLTDLNKKPEEKNIDITPNIINESLQAEINKFSKELVTLLRNEPYKTQIALQDVKDNGYSSKSKLEWLVKKITPKGTIDNKAIPYIFENTLEALIKNVFNTVFSQPQQLEEYLKTLISSLNKVFDNVPDPSSREGKALKEDMIEKQKMKEELVNALLVKEIDLQTENQLDDLFKRLSKQQKENLIVAYRKIKKKAHENLLEVAQDSSDILNSSNYAQPTSAQSKHAKEDIEKAIKDIDRLSKAINNIVLDENDLIKNSIKDHTKSFRQYEQTLKDSIQQINQLHDKKEGLRQLKQVLQNLKKSFDGIYLNSANQISDIEKHLNTLNEINKNHQFDELASRYKHLQDQITKIKAHGDFAKTLQELITNTFFSKNLIYNLAKAQKEYILYPTSDGKEQALTNARTKVKVFLKDLENSFTLQDLTELKQSVKKILDSSQVLELEEAYRDTLALVRKKISKHNSLHQDEQTVLPTFYDKAKFSIDFDVEQIPKESQIIHNQIIKQAELLTTTTEKMQASIKDIGKENLSDKIGYTTIVKILAAISSFAAGYLGFITPLTSYVVGGASLAYAPFKLRSAITSASRAVAKNVGVPLAKTTVDSAYKLGTNPAFYEGLIHTIMKSFVDYIKESKGSL